MLMMVTHPSLPRSLSAAQSQVPFKASCDDHIRGFTSEQSLSSEVNSDDIGCKSTSGQHSRPSEERYIKASIVDMIKSYDGNDRMIPGTLAMPP